MEERAACAHLKRRFEAAGFRIKENQTFDEDGVWFEIDGFDAARRVGYEYVTKEAGDGWDVDGDVIAKLTERRQRGELHVLVVDEVDAPDAASLDHAIDAFLEELPAAKTAAAPAPEAEAPEAELEAEHETEIDTDDEAGAEALEPDAVEPEPAPAAKRKPPPTPPAKPAKSTRPPPTPKSAKKKPARKSK